MGHLLPKLQKPISEPGCRLLEDLEALRQLEGALEIIESRKGRAGDLLLPQRLLGRLVLPGTHLCACANAEQHCGKAQGLRD